MITVSEFFVNYLINKGITDIFGMPGGVVLDFLYALDARKEITAHLSYHEQCAAFEACGYSQFQYHLGAVYATRGPGFTNLITAIADAYADSVPVLFITAHSSCSEISSVRFETDQELDTISMVKHITKYAAKLDDINRIPEEIEKACSLAISGRKGPVLLDFFSDLWKKELPDSNFQKNQRAANINIEASTEDFIKIVTECLQTSERPLLLIGDGIRQSNTVDYVLELAKMLKLPIISSRGSQDVASKYDNYYGYLGSHGMRYSNFIFVKADLVLSFGNRLSFPLNSPSFSQAFKNKKIIRVDIDRTEFLRHIPNSISFEMDLKTLLPQIILGNIKGKNTDKWLSICETLKKKLNGCDINSAVKCLYKIFKVINNQYPIVSDVGNHEFWVSRAYELAGVSNRILYSRSFGTLGCAIGKAIGVYYACKMPVICVVGDQGFQMNIQELQLLIQNQLPIAVILINNHSSGMIRDREKNKYGEYFVHATEDSGYSTPDYAKVSECYGISYYSWKEENVNKICRNIQVLRNPCLIEITVDESIELTPTLPKGYPCQKLVPELPEDTYIQLDYL